MVEDEVIDLPDGATRPIRILQLRSLRGGGGGPESTILAYAEGGGPPGFEVSVCYLRNREDPEFTVGTRASKLGVTFHEICERGAVEQETGKQYKLQPSVLVRLQAIEETEGRREAA